MGIFWGGGGGGKLSCLGGGGGEASPAPPSLDETLVADVNDNSPMLVDCPETVTWISQHAAQHSPVTGVNATDPDL